MAMRIACSTFAAALALMACTPEPAAERPGTAAVPVAEVVGLLDATCGATRPNFAGATVRMQAGYDHSYFFVASFMADHIGFHAEALYA